MGRTHTEEPERERTPAERPEAVKMAVLTPTTRPAESSSGPPELPGLMAASVWMAPPMLPPSWLWISLPRPLMTPAAQQHVALLV